MSTGKINLLHTVLSLGFAGLERVVTELTLRMDKSRFNVEVCSFNKLGPFAEVINDAGLKVWMLEKNRNHFDPRDTLRLVRYLRKNDFHIVNTHSGTFFEATLAARLARVPVVVYTDHGRPKGESLKRMFEDSLTARFCDRWVAVSDELRGIMIHKVKFPKRKMRLILNGVNMETFAPRPKPETLLREFHIPENAKVVGTVGRLEKIKDQASLIAALDLVRKQLPNTILMLVGGGALEEQLKDQVTTLGLGNSVIFTGKRTDIPDVLNLFDLFVLSSLSEGTSVSLLEAMASGLPAVVTNVGGNPEIVDHGTNGLLINVGDPRGLSDALLKLLADDAQRASMARSAREKIGREYGLDRMVSQYERLFLQLLHKKGKFTQWAV